MTADILLAVWAVFWGSVFAGWIDPSKGRRLDLVHVVSLLVIVAFPVFCVHAARWWP